MDLAALTKDSGITVTATVAADSLVATFTGQRGVPAVEAMNAVVCSPTCAPS